MPDGSTVKGLNFQILSPPENASGEVSTLLTSDQLGAGPLGGTPAGVSLPTTSGKGAEGPAKPFILSEGLPPVSAKLVVRNLRGDFIGMADLTPG